MPEISFKLNTGAKIPGVGLGTWQSAPGVVKKSVTSALNAGYRHIDCAPAYLNETEVGAGIKEVISSGSVKREDLFITSKLWASDFYPQDVQLALEKTLKDLQLGYLDLFLIHVPVQLKKPMKFPLDKSDRIENWDMAETWKAMEDLVEKKLVKAIGVSNFTIKKLETLLSSNPKIIPAVNQVEMHPLWRQEKLLNFCKSKGIHVEAYSPLGSPGRPVLEKEKPVLLETPLIEHIATKLQKSPGQILLRWGLQRGTTVLPKSVNEERILQNIDVYDWEIPTVDFEAISKIEPQIRMLDFRGIWVGDNHPVKSVEEMWDGEI